MRSVIPQADIFIPLPYADSAEKKVSLVITGQNIHNAPSVYLSYDKDANSTLFIGNQRKRYSYLVFSAAYLEKKAVDFQIMIKGALFFFLWILVGVSPSVFAKAQSGADTGAESAPAFGLQIRKYFRKHMKPLLLVCMVLLYTAVVIFIYQNNIRETLEKAESKEVVRQEKDSDETWIEMSSDEDMIVESFTGQEKNLSAVSFDISAEKSNRKAEIRVSVLDGNNNIVLLSEPIKVSSLPSSRTTMKLYLDGEAVATGTARTSDPPPNAYFQLFTTGGNKTWGGELREARVWNYARTQAQIVDAMNDSAQGTETGLLGCWPMDEGAGATAIVNKKTGATHAISVNNSWLTGQSTAPTFAEPQPEPPVVENSVEFGGAWFGAARTEKAIDVQDFTFETWVRPTAMHGSQTFLFSQWARGENGQGDANNPNRFLIGFNDTDHFGFFIAGTDGMGNRGGWQHTTETVPLNEWTHLATTRQGSTLRFYINGQLKKTINGYTTLSPWNADKPHCLTLGGTDTAYNTDEGRMLQGSMREVRVWNKALSALRISRIYNHKVNVAEEPNLIGYWPMEKPNAADSSLLVNEAVAGGEEGYILAGWSRVEALNLADPAPPIGTVFIFR